MSNLVKGFYGKRIFLWGILLLLSFGCMQKFAYAQQTVNVDLNTKYQTFQGWGVSLAWWANVVGGYPNTSRDNYINLIYDPVLGLGLNVDRYNIGGGENPEYLPPNKTFLQYRARVPGFLASANGTYDWTQDANQRWVLEQSILKGADDLEAFSNSPPWWMTNSGSVTGAENGGNNLNPSYATDFADYLATVVQHYHDAWGITFSTLEPFNEPSSNWWTFGTSTQEGCGFNVTTQNSFIKTLESALASKGMNYTSIAASDENSIDTALSTFQAMDSTSLSDISQVNTHAYNGSDRTQLMQAVMAAHKNLWMSEYGDGDASGMTMASEIVKDLKQMEPTAWVYWQAVDNAGGWGFLSNPLDGSTNYAYTVNEKYYVMGNFSKFIRPGYQFVDISDPDSVAAYDGHGTLAIVSVSSGSSSKQVTYSLSGFGNGPWTVTAYQTSSNENLVQKPSFVVTSSSFTQMLPANSVTTFVVKNSVPAPVVDGGEYYIYNMWGGNTTGTATNQQLIQDGGWNPNAGFQLSEWGNSYNSSSNTWPANQIWVAHSAGGSNWVFTNLKNGYAIDTNGQSAGSAVVQNTQTDNTSQVWSLVPVGDGSFKMVNEQSGLELIMPNWWGVGLVQNSDNKASNSNNHWVFVPYQGSKFTTQLAFTTYTSSILTTAEEQLSVVLTSDSPNSPTGTVTFYDGSNVLGKVTTWSSKGVVNFDAGELTAGTHYIYAVYSGDGSNMASSTPEITILATKPIKGSTTTTLQSSSSTAKQGQSLVLTALVQHSGTALFNGNVVFSSNGTQLASVPLTGDSAIFTTKSLAAGVYGITATYSGNDSYNASTSSILLQTVSGSGTTPSTTTLSVSPAVPIVGGSVTLSAAVTGSGGTPTGAVSFMDGSVLLGSVALGSSGSASLATSVLAAGSHQLSAIYTGDATFSMSTSSSVGLQVYPVPVGDFVISPRDSVVSPGSPDPIAIATSGGFNQPIQFSCSGLPSGYSCVFSPASVTPGSGLTTTTLTIQSSTTASLLAIKSSSKMFLAFCGFGLLLFPLSKKGRKQWRKYLMALAVLGLISFSITGCSTGNHSSTQTVTITGTSLPLSHSVTVQVKQG